ncbi:hypothetical protein N9955_00650 [bacterium]|nr:hypothetical protein [bacterium]
MHFVCNSLITNELWRRRGKKAISRLVSVTYGGCEKNLVIFCFLAKKVSFRFLFKDGAGNRLRG